MNGTLTEDQVHSNPIPYGRFLAGARSADHIFGDLSLMSQVELLAEDLTVKEKISQLRPRLVTPSGEVVDGPEGPDWAAELEAISEEELGRQLDQVVPREPDARLASKIIDQIFPPRTIGDPEKSRIEPVDRRRDLRRERELAADARTWHIAVADTSMRDGRRDRAEPPSRADRVALALALDELGTDIIEAGSMAWEGDFRAVQHVAPAVERAVVCVLARCTSDLADVRLAVQARRGARRRRVNLAAARQDLPADDHRI